MVGIYKITNLINGKFYIGQSIDINRRFWDHRCISHESNRHLRFALKKYGISAFSYEVIEECEPQELDSREQYWISTLKPDYNVMPGGQGRGRPHAEETKSLLSEKGKEHWNSLSEAEKNRIIKDNLKGPKIGHAVFDSTKIKLRDKNLGKRQSTETIEKRKATFLEKKKNGYMQTNAGHRKRIVCIETGEIFPSVKSAGERLCVDPSNISSVLKGRQKTTKGFTFKYLEV